MEKGTQQSRRSIWFALLAVLAVSAAVIFTQSGRFQKYLYESTVRRLSKAQPFAATSMQDVAFTNVNLISMRDDIVRPNHTVIVRNGRIHAIRDGVGDESDYSVRVIDVEGSYLMPGLADMHVHVQGMPSELLLLIANGVTTARVMAGKPRLLELRDRIAGNEILGPQLYVAGPIIREKIREGLPADTSVAPLTVEETRREIEHQNSLGYDFVKPYTFISRDNYLAAAETATELAMPLVGHIPFSIGLEGIIEADQREVAHVHEFNKYFFRAYNQTQFFTTAWPIDETRTPDIVGTVKNAELNVTTTLWVNQMLMEANEDFAAYMARPMMQYELQSARSYMTSGQWQFSTWDPVYLRNTYIPWLHRFTKALSDNGVTLILGTDSGYPGLLHGFGVHEELQLLVECGLTPYEALQTATRNAALAVGKSADWGTVEAGKRADLLLVRGNPLDDISNTSAILGVMVSGQWFERSELDTFLKHVERIRQ